LAPAVLAAAFPLCAPAAPAYQPRFARLQTPAAVLDFSTCPKPAYPRSSLRNEETGTVTMLFIVAPTGRPIKGIVQRSSGFRDLDNAALASMSQCRFRPASIDNVPVQGTTMMQYVWTLE
jgi:protein TonB